MPAIFETGGPSKYHWHRKQYVLTKNLWAVKLLVLLF